MVVDLSGFRVLLGFFVWVEGDSLLMRYVGMRCAVLLSVFGFAGLSFLSPVSYADRFYLTEDRLIEGILVREDTTTVTFKLDGAGLWTLSRHSLHRVDRESPGEYWMRLGERHARGNRDRTCPRGLRKSPTRFRNERQASRRLKDLNLLMRNDDSTPVSETVVQIPREESPKERPSSPKLAEIEKEEKPATPPPPAAAPSEGTCRNLNSEVAKVAKKEPARNRPLNAAQRKPPPHRRRIRRRQQ